MGKPLARRRRRVRGARPRSASTCRRSASPGTSCARASGSCDREGIHSVWFMDHLYPPGTARGAVVRGVDDGDRAAACTERIRLGHLVLANGFRHPALLAKMAVTLDHASGGRLDLGLGSGSYPPEYAQFGLEFPPDARARRAARRGAAGAEAALHRGRADLRRPPLPARRRAEPAAPAADAAPADPRRRRGRAPHAAARRAPRRRLELPDLRARASCRASSTALRAECARIGRDPAIAPRHRGGGARARAARATRWRTRATLALRRFPGPGWGVETGGWCGTPDDDPPPHRGARARSASPGFVFFLHDRAAPETIRLLAREVVPRSEPARAPARQIVRQDLAAERSSRSGALVPDSTTSESSQSPAGAAQLRDAVVRRPDEEERRRQQRRGRHAEHRRPCPRPRPPPPRATR